MKAPCILLIDSDKNINEANKNALELEGYEVYAARTLQKGKKLCGERQPDLIVLEQILSDANALGCVEELKKKTGAGVLILSSLDTREDVVCGLRAGGDDYMTKPYLMEELLLRVRSLLSRNDRAISRDDFSTGKLRWHVAAKQIERDGTMLPLQPKEYAVLEYLQRCSARFVPVKELARQIWLTEDYPNVEASVRNTVYCARKKIRDSGCGIVLKRGAGYRFTSEP